MPLVQRTAQEVMVEALSSGPTVVLLIGAHTNFALFLMTHPHLKKNVEHIYIMGGGVRSRNPKGCCPRNATSCTPTQCGDRGNLFTGYNSNPFAEFNIYGDPFAAYQVFHSGIPITLVPLDATNTILITEAFFNEFEANQKTYEAQYVFESLRIVRDTWFDNLFYSSYFMWDSFTSGVAVSSIRNGHLNSDANEFAELEYMNVTVVTSNAPYGINDGSNPFFDNRRVPKFKLKKGGVHSGHVQTGLEDPFCFVPNGKGKCQDAYTQEISGSEGVRILVATKAKENPDKNSSLTRAFYPDFLNVLNRPSQSAKFNLKTEFPYYREVLYIPSFKEKKLGIPMIFDMDMDPGDIIILFYLLKMPVELINLKAITINGNGWANAATIDIVYDVLHMMGRDDIKVGLGEFFALNQSYSSNSAVGNCKYSKAIPYGSGGFIDTDSLFGLARDLPRSPRRYTAQNSVKFGAIRDTEHPEWRQPEAQEIFQNVQNGLKSGEKITILATGPLSNIAQFLSTSNGSNIERLYIVGGNLDGDNASTGNLFSVPENKRAEFNFFLDPLAARNVISSNVNITLIPLKVQRNVSDLERLRTVLKRHRKTPEAAFVHRLVSRMLFLSHRRHYYRHLGMFVGEVVGGPLLAQQKDLKVKSERLPVRVIASGNVSNDGVIIVDKHNGRLIDVVKEMDSSTYYSHLAKWLNRREQSAVLASFSAQTRLWRTPPTM